MSDPKELFEQNQAEIEGSVVYVKTDNSRPGVGDLACKLAWESDPDMTGAYAHLSYAPDGESYLSFTDMENMNGSYYSIEIPPEDIARLEVVLRIARAEQTQGPSGTME